MFSSLFKISFVCIAFLALSQAFAPSVGLRPAEMVDTSLNLFGGKKKDKKPKPGEMDKNVFGGRGARITIREDEDNAMVRIHEPGRSFSYSGTLASR